MSSTKIDTTQIDLPGTSTDLLSGDGTTAITPGTGIAIVGASLDVDQTVGGDLSGTTVAATVTGLQNNPVSATVPSAGQALAWTGAAWAPATISGGGGGGDSGGFLYYLENSTPGALPAPVGSSEMDRSYTPAPQSTVAVVAPQSPVYATLATFVTPVGDPSVTTIPAGIWDVALYASSTGLSGETGFRFLVQTWDGITATTIATSADEVISGPPAIVDQYTASVFVPPTIVTASTRLIIVIEVTRYVVAAQTVTGYFEGSTVSHAHTSIGAPGGTGLLKVVAGVLQTPASLLVNADVDNAAAIAQSKIANLTTDLAARITQAEHKTLRQLIHLANQGPYEGFASGAYQETLPAAAVFPTSFIWWESAAKIKKIVEETVTYNPTGTIATDEWKVYDTDGVTVLATVTDTIAYSGVFETSRTRTVV